MGFSVETCSIAVDESSQPNESPKDLVCRLALAKVNDCVQRFASECDWPIIAADTVIDLDGEIVGKPKNREDAIATLLALSDRSHWVHTGVCVANGPNLNQLVVSTEVTMAAISRDQAEDYWETGEPVDKAGSYAIQGIGARFVARIAGSYSNVVGLPLFETVDLLQNDRL